MKKYKTADGTIDIPAGVPFVKDNVQYPGNWLESLSPAELTAMGMTKYDVPDVVPPEPEPEPAKTYKADIFRRMTDAEYDMYEVARNQQTKKKRAIFDHATHITHGTQEFAELQAAFNQVFGLPRALILLAPSGSNQ